MAGPRAKLAGPLCPWGLEQQAGAPGLREAAGPERPTEAEGREEEKERKGRRFPP